MPWPLGELSKGSASRTPLTVGLEGSAAGNVTQGLQLLLQQALGQQVPHKVPQNGPAIGQQLQQELQVLLRMGLMGEGTPSMGQDSPTDKACPNSQNKPGWGRVLRLSPAQAQAAAKTEQNSAISALGRGSGGDARPPCLPLPSALRWMQGQRWLWQLLGRTQGGDTGTLPQSGGVKDPKHVLEDGGQILQSCSLQSHGRAAFRQGPQSSLWVQSAAPSQSQPAQLCSPSPCASLLPERWEGGQARSRMGTTPGNLPTLSSADFRQRLPGATQLLTQSHATAPRQRGAGGLRVHRGGPWGQGLGVSGCTRGDPGDKRLWGSQGAQGGTLGTARQRTGWQLLPRSAHRMDSITPKTSTDTVAQCHPSLGTASAWPGHPPCHVTEPSQCCPIPTWDSSVGPSSGDAISWFRARKNLCRECWNSATSFPS